MKNKGVKGQEFENAIVDWLLLKILIKKRYVKKYGERAKLWFGYPYL